jgi:hypothetical protein
MLCSTSLFTACSDDDDEGGNSTSRLKAGVFTIDSGTQYRLTKVGWDYSFYYDESGNLEGINDMEVTSSPFQIIESDSYGSSVATCYFNSQGYVSTIKYVDEEKGSDYLDSYSGTISLSYNSSNQLTKISISESGTEKEDGETFKYSGSCQRTFTYKDGNLISCTEVDKGSEGGEKYSETSVYTFAYDDDENVYGQYTEGIFETMDIGDALAGLALVGYMGKASKYLPVLIDVTYKWEEDGEEGESSHSYTYSYTLNSDKLVASEKQGTSKYTTATLYTYSTLTKAVEDLQPKETNVDETTSKSQHRRTWRLRNRNHK